MTRAEALAEARRRWPGSELFAIMAKDRTRVIVRNTLFSKAGSRVRRLGVVGIGSSWEAAFADADRRAGEARP